MLKEAVVSIKNWLLNIVIVNLLYRSVVKASETYFQGALFSLTDPTGEGDNLSLNIAEDTRSAEQLLACVSDI